MTPLLFVSTIETLLTLENYNYLFKLCNFDLLGAPANPQEIRFSMLTFLVEVAAVNNHPLAFDSTLTLLNGFEYILSLIEKNEELFITKRPYLDTTKSQTIMSCIIGIKASINCGWVFNCIFDWKPSQFFRNTIMSTKPRSYSAVSKNLDHCKSVFSNSKLCFNPAEPSFVWNELLSRKKESMGGKISVSAIEKASISVSKEKISWNSSSENYMENSNRRFENIFQSATAPLRAVCEIRDEMNGAVVYFQNVADQYDKRLSILDDKIEKITKNLLYNGKTTATVELRVEEIFEAMRSLNVKVNNQTKVMQLGDSFTVEMLNSMRIVLNETSVTATQTREMLRNSINSDRDCSII